MEELSGGDAMVVVGRRFYRAAQTILSPRRQVEEKPSLGSLEVRVDASTVQVTGASQVCRAGGSSEEDVEDGEGEEKGRGRRANA